jgi:exodeoxyribonuclease VII, large subunit
VTAPTGAAIRDIMNIAHRRNPYVQLILYPALVQGDGAKDSIVKGIRTLDAMGLDVLIVGRGGGSIEDLWAFNEEEVARAIFACNTPVISAVGHETDVTIADYAADLRAPTPSAAAELAVFDYFQFQMDLNARKQRLMKEMATCLDRTKSRLRQDMLTLRFYDPKSQLNEKKKRLADAEDTLLRLIAQRQQEARRDLQNAETLLQREMKDRLAADKRNLAVKSARLWGLSPLKKISDGFGFITDGDGKRLETVEQAVPGSRITVRVKDGRIGATVNNVENYDIRTSGQEKLSQ